MSDENEYEVNHPPEYLEQKKIKHYHDFLGGLRLSIAAEVGRVGHSRITSEEWDDDSHVLVMLLNIDQTLSKAQDWLRHVQESEQVKQPQGGMFGMMQGGPRPETTGDDDGHGSYL